MGIITEKSESSASNLTIDQQRALLVFIRILLWWSIQRHMRFRDSVEVTL